MAWKRTVSRTGDSQTPVVNGSSETGKGRRGGGLSITQPTHGPEPLVVQGRLTTHVDGTHTPSTHPSLARTTTHRGVLEGGTGGRVARVRTGPQERRGRSPRSSASDLPELTSGFPPDKDRGSPRRGCTERSRQVC